MADPGLVRARDDERNGELLALPRGERCASHNLTRVALCATIRGDTMNPKIRQVPGFPDTPEDQLSVAYPGGFTIRDEANALTEYAFRNGPLEDLHAGASSPLSQQS